MIKYNRAFALGLAALMTAGCISCSNADNQQKSTVTESESTDTQAVTAQSEQELHPLPEKNMDGFELRFYNYNNNWMTWAINQLDADSENGDNVNDEIYRRNRRIEDKYNCVITETAVDNTLDNFRNIVMSGDDAYDIAFVYDEQVANLYSEGLISSWDRLEYVNLDCSWWNQNANDVFQINGKQFAAVGDFTLAMLTRGFVLLFNKDMYDAANLDDNLYDLVRSNQWTLDKFAEISMNFVNDLDGNGVYDENDQYATTGAVKLHFGSLVTGCGVKYISVGEDGLPYFNIPGNTRAMDVLQKIFDIHNGTGIFYKVVNDVHNGSNEAREMFKSHKIVFQGTSTKGIEYYRDVDFDIGILPYPKYDSEQEEYYILTSGCGVPAIPATLSDDRCENVGILLDALCRDSQENLVPTYKDVVLKVKYSNDADSAEMLDIIFKSAAFDLGLSMWPNVTYYKYMESYLNMVDNFSSLTASLEPQVQANIDKLVEALEENG
ncbi:MAG TPA: hypothetical protein H9681_01765 [Firmicutes bacterium]|nr:hypothetical protein [Bacillota bacterium]